MYRVRRDLSISFPSKTVVVFRIPGKQQRKRRRVSEASTSNDDERERTLSSRRGEVEHSNNGLGDDPNETLPYTLEETSSSSLLGSFDRFHLRKGRDTNQHEGVHA